MTEPGDTPLGRVLREAGGPAVLKLLSEELAGADLTTLLLEVFRQRAARLAPADLLRRYTGDRFAGPASMPFHQLRDAEDQLLSAIGDDFEVLTLSPVAPLGTHSAVATVDQNKVVSTIRGSEVAADPTNGLALEAALRRRTAPDRTVRLAAIQRVVRAQGAGGHFGLLGMVTAGRDTGNLAFEKQHAIEHLRLIAGATGTAQIRLTVFDPRYARVAEAIEREFDDVERTPRRPGYYSGLCFKVFTPAAGEVADGGFVTWTQQLLNNRKERLMISGVGIERLAHEIHRG